MTTEYSGTGDPKRSIELLWRTQDKPGAAPKRGPKPRLTVDQIALVGVELADREGLGAVSMRRIADQLGITAMSIYTYVPSKAELIDVMLDVVYGELGRPGGPDEEAPEGWRAKLEQVARDNWALYRRHPWLLQVATSRPVLGPNLAAKYESELSTVAGIGLTEVEMDQVVTLMSDYVHGAVRSAVQAVQIEQHTGMTDEEWWQAYAPLLAEVLDPERYALASQVGTAAGQEYGAAVDPGRSFDFGLQRMLDGLEVFVQSRTR